MPKNDCLMVAKLTISGQHCDEAIWDSFRSGDAKAYGLLYERFYGILLKNCHRFCEDETLIKDCIHDLFLEIWKNKVNLVTPRSVKAYLLCSTQRKLFRAVRKNRRGTDLPSEYRMTGHPVENGMVVFSIEDKIIGEQVKQELVSAIDKTMVGLTKRQRQAVHMRFYCNMSYPCIAHTMGIGTASVYNLISKALEQIRSRLGNGKNFKN